jgi:SAM-dependent methyltransferase
MSDVDFGKRSDDYAEHRPGFPDSFYDRLESFRKLEGSRAVDVGTGPGTIALELARRGATVTGLDIAENQIRAARQRADAEGLADRCSFCVGGAERIDAGDASFDLATAGQCWHWFDESAAIAELLRVLRPGGLLVVAHDCYLARHDELARATEELILRLNPGWTMAGASGLYPEHVDALIFGGFELVEQFCYDHDHRFTHAGWRGRMRTCNGIGSGPLSDERVEAFDRALAALLRERFPAAEVAVRHRVWATVARRP